jgi:hypothetical protein
MMDISSTKVVERRARLRPAIGSTDEGSSFAFSSTIVDDIGI